MNMRLETKQDFRDWMFSVLNPLKPLYSEGGARLHLGDSGVTYPEVSIEMEAFPGRCGPWFPSGRAAE